MDHNVASLLSLPVELLSLLPGYLSDLDDLISFRSTNRLLHSIAPRPDDLLRLSYASRRTFFRPDPLFLLSRLIPAISTYAHQSELKRTTVHKAICGGNDSLLLFAVSTPAIADLAGWSLEKIKTSWEWRMRVVNPVSDMLDRCVGKQWCEVDDFWSGGRDDAVTLFAEPEETFYHLMMYGDMFGRDLEEWLESSHVGETQSRKNDDSSILVGRSKESVSIDPAVRLRLDFLKHCIPDFANDHSGAEAYPKTEGQAVILHLFLRSPLFDELSWTIRTLCGAVFDRAASTGEASELYWEQELWKSSARCLGREGMEILAQVWEARKRGVGPETKPSQFANWFSVIDRSGEGWQRLRRWRKLINGLSKEPERVRFAERYTYRFPFMLGDLKVSTGS